MAAKQAIDRMATAILDGQPTPALAKAMYKTAEAGTPGQPEPQLLYGLALLKARQFPEGLKNWRKCGKNTAANCWLWKG